MVERQLPKLNVAGSNPVVRSTRERPRQAKCLPGPLFSGQFRELRTTQTSARAAVRGRHPILRRVKPEAIEIPLSTPIRWIKWNLLLVFPDQCALAQRRESDVRLNMSEGEVRVIRSAPLGRGIGDVVAAEIGLEPLRCFRLPEGEAVRISSWKNYLRRKRLPMVQLVCCVAFLWAILSGALPFDVINPLGLIAVFVVCFFGFLVFALMLIDRSGWGYAINGQRWRLRELVLEEDRSEAAARQVDEVKEEYGRLLSDLAYRVDNPALFDAAVPETEALTLALFRWDSEWPRLETEDRVALAAQVVSFFRAARRHAERVGMRHLPETARDDARRALKAIRLALDESTTPAERKAAAGLARQLLSGLALYYLPSRAEVSNALGGRRLKQLPGRRRA